MSAVEPGLTLSTEPVAEEAERRWVPLGERLLADGLVQAADLAAAVAEQRRSGGRLGEILVARGLLSETDLARSLAGALHLRFRDPVVEPPDPEVVRRLPLAVCRRRHVLPVAERDGALVLAMANPVDLVTVDDVRTLVGQPVRPEVVVPRQLDHVTDQLFQGDPFAVEGHPGAVVRSEETPRPIEVDMAAAHAQAPVVEFVNRLLARAVTERCSDVHVEPTEDAMRIRFRIDGILGDAGLVPPALRAGVATRLKVMAGMDIAEHRRPQDGRMSLDLHGRPIDIRVATLPTVHGEAMVLRLLERDEGLLELNNLGFRPGPLQRYRSAYAKTWGLVLVSGPTGSGKSTTLYATLNGITDQTRNVVTVEDPVEYQLAGIKQTQVNLKIDYDFANGLRAALRADPDIILIGEVRDLETARIASDAAMTGHLVFSTLHANDAAQSTTRLIDMGLEPYRVISSLVCVVAQRLVRRLCERCTEPSVASAVELVQLVDLGLVPDPAAVVYRPVGCAGCNGSGYYGRLAVQEVLVMTDELRSLVLGRATPDRIAAAAVASGMETLRQDAYAKVLVGQTSVEELIRVVG